MKPLRLGHIHLKVRDLDRSIQFYQEILGLNVTEQVGSFAFLSDGKIHHSLALQALGLEARPPTPFSVGLYHVAFEVDTAAELALAYHEAEKHGRVDAVDHGISWAIYFQDPDGNGLEIYLDRREATTGRPIWDGWQAPLALERVLAG
ncbi:MAG: VOC family protein [Fimbriimonas sp.]